MYTIFSVVKQKLMDQYTVVPSPKVVVLGAQLAALE
jgi:hypothetical protein